MIQLIHATLEVHTLITISKLWRVDTLELQFQSYIHNEYRTNQTARRIGVCGHKGRIR